MTEAEGMLDRVRKFLEQRGTATSRGAEREPVDELHLATATLLMEISRADSHVDSDERRVIEQALRRLFDLGAEEARRLAAAAEDEAEGAVSLYPFTRRVDKEFSPARKKKIVELLWRVSFADGELDKYEEYMIRKIADLLHVSHADFMHAKHLARSRG
jgi:uncharacterized tellurite resistance protein B-like protein